MQSKDLVSTIEQNDLKKCHEESSSYEDTYTATNCRSFFCWSF